MADSIIQSSFAAGELSPALYARVDLDKYKVGAALLYNFFVDYRGGAATRAGTQFCGRAKVTGGLTVRLLDFVVSTAQSYAIELGQNYARFYQNGAQVVEGAKTVTGITMANPAVFTSAAHGYSNGNEVVLSGVLGPVSLNNKNYLVTGVTTNTYTLTDLDGNVVSTASLPAYISGGQTTRIFEIATPWAAADLALLKYAQSADTMTLVHPNYPVYNIVRQTASTFSIAVVKYGPQIDPPTNLVVTVTTKENDSNYWPYQVTAVSANGKEESLPCDISIVTGSELDTGQHSNKLIWVAPSELYSYFNIYKSQNGRTRSNGSTDLNTVFGYIGQSKALVFTDSNIAPDFTKAPSEFQDPFSPGQIARVDIISGGTSGAYGSVYTVPLVFTGDGSGAAGYGLVSLSTNTVVSVVITSPGKNYTTVTVTDSVGNATYTATLGQASGTYPTTVQYYQQRRAFGGTLNAPESLVFSQPGNYTNFDSTIFGLASDSITVSLAARQVNTIKSMVPMSTGLVVFTSGGGFLVSGGGQGAAITPENITALPQASSGANDMPPLVINYDILYCQNRGAVVRDLSFNYYVQSYTGTDRSVLASHLFTNYTLQEWCWAEEPNRFINIVRSDGQILSFTYVPEQEVFGWTHWQTNGLFKSICSIPENNTNAVYTVVQRVINGITVNYIERFANRNFSSIQTSWCVDAGLSYQNNTAFTTISGLSHLEGQVVTGLADGMVFTKTVTGGTIILDQPANQIIVGLGYTCQLQTLQIDTGEPTTQGKRKTIPAVTLRLKDSLGLKVGHDNTSLQELPQQGVPYSVAPQLFTGDIRQLVGSAWDTPGQLLVQQDNPLPATLLGIIPEVVIGDTTR